MKTFISHRADQKLCVVIEGPRKSGKWVSLDELEELIHARPYDFTGGLIKALEFYKAAGT